jgi:hypothetical protein
MTVSPDRVAASRSGALTFTYPAGARGLRASGEVTLVAARGWTPPSRAPGTAGYARQAWRAVSIRQADHRHRVTLGPAEALTITYRTARAPGGPGIFVFRAFQARAAARRLAALATFPSVLVVAAAPRSPSRTILLLMLVVLAAACAAVHRPARAFPGLRGHRPARGDQCRPACRRAHRAL